MLTASILASSMAFVDGSVVHVALPAIQADLGSAIAAAFPRSVRGRAIGTWPAFSALTTARLRRWRAVLLRRSRRT